MNRRGLFGLSAGAVAVAALPAAASEPHRAVRTDLPTKWRNHKTIATQWDKQLAADPDDWASVIGTIDHAPCPFWRAG